MVLRIKRPQVQFTINRFDQFLALDIVVQNIGVGRTGPRQLRQTAQQVGRAGRIFLMHRKPDDRGILVGRPFPQIPGAGCHRQHNDQQKAEDQQSVATAYPCRSGHRQHVLTRRLSGPLRPALTGFGDMLQVIGLVGPGGSVVGKVLDGIGPHRLCLHRLCLHGRDPERGLGGCFPLCRLFCQPRHAPWAGCLWSGFDRKPWGGPADLRQGLARPDLAGFVFTCHIRLEYSAGIA